jgi:hypothetical protein
MTWHMITTSYGYDAIEHNSQDSVRSQYTWYRSMCRRAVSTVRVTSWFGDPHRSETGLAAMSSAFNPFPPLIGSEPIRVLRASLTAR